MRGKLHTYERNDTYMTVEIMYKSDTMEILLGCWWDAPNDQTCNLHNTQNFKTLWSSSTQDNALHFLVI